MTNDIKKHSSGSVTLDQVERFLSARRPVSAESGKLIFSLDCTASRSDTWTTAQKLQSKMLREHAGALSLQLVYYRGEECKASKWTTNADRLAASMAEIECVAASPRSHESSGMPCARTNPSAQSEV